MKKVLVTGVTGRTGSIVFSKLRQYQGEFQVMGLARFPDKVQKLFNSTDGFFFGDLLKPDTLRPAFVDCQALVILTSATPRLKNPSQQGVRPEMEFPPGEMPEQIDYYGQKHQIDAAKDAGVEHIVLVGSMGGTNPAHFLNTIGNGNILIWKRKAEEYLIHSGIDYTIIRAGGLIDESGGKRELLVGKDDVLLNNPPDEIKPVITRADLAEAVVQALQHQTARNKAFDLISKPENHPGSVVTKDFATLFAQTTSG